MLAYDGTDVRDLTRGEMEGRRQAMLAIKRCSASRRGSRRRL
jgi:hypothetical protein